MSSFLRLSRLKFHRCPRYALLAFAIAIQSGCKKQELIVKPPPEEAGPVGKVDAVPASIPAALPKEVSFNGQIQPILSEYCYHCHGPDSGTRKPSESPLRLDREAEAFAKRENGKPVIVKGDPAASLLIQLIKKSKDDKELMPPLESHKELKPHEIALLEEWVRQGAKYEPHWAFMPVKRPEEPKVEEGFAANPIDRFVVAKLDEAALQPNAPEDPRRFFRKLALDITGLPPSPAETDAFVASYARDPDAAVNEAADQLLATPASAEHFARQWLDAARYSDTHGIHIDNYRMIWPYRDWVIRAFQGNMPWDRFTVEQLAGDLLPDASLDQQIATGFNRCLPTTGEGGAIAEEYEAIYAKDRTDTTAAVWLGLTTGCAACHDHKFDPISTKEFYSFTAFFRNTTMEALDRNMPAPPPAVFAPAIQDREKWTRVEKLLAEARGKLAAREKESDGDFRQWLDGQNVSTPPVEDASLVVHVPLSEEQGPVRGRVDGQPREWDFDAERREGALGQAVVVSSTPVGLDGVDAFGEDGETSYAAFVRIEGTPSGVVAARMNPERPMLGTGLYLQKGALVFRSEAADGGQRNTLVAGKPLSPGMWHHMVVTRDGSGAAIYVDGVRQGAKLDPKSVPTDTKAETALVQIGSRLPAKAKGGADSVSVQDFRVYRRALPPAEITDLSANLVVKTLLAVPSAQRNKSQQDRLLRHYIEHVDGLARELRSKIASLTAERAKLEERGSLTLVMDERKDSKPFAHVLTRGVYSDKGEKVEPGTLAALPPMAADLPRNRLGLARWLVDPANPLPARVTMNRLWHYFFGTGIVETTEDFGLMGARPSHPELLDWLASEFVASKWDYRHMVKLIVTSASYRQSESATTEKLEKDPLNRLLSRGPRVRLEAEQLRDLALEVSGLMVTKVGGPPVKPYQPEGIWEAVAMKQSNTRNYEQDKGEGLYRRSLYTFWKRSAPPPSMELFNAPSREVFCVRRERTNTPLQALVLLNDPQFVEASKLLAAHAMQAGSSADERLDFITLRLLGRVLRADERQVAATTLEELLDGYRAAPKEASQLLAAGATAAPSGLDPVELAAWTLLASQVLNLDETVTR